MAFFVSPGVKIREVDLTNIVPGVSSSEAAFVGEFRWGPVEEAVLVDSEQSLVRYFGTPLKSSTSISTCFFTAASFLAYGNRLRCVRTVDADDAKNAVAGTAGTEPGILVKNDTHYLGVTGYAGTARYVAKYPGSLGNSLKISLCGSSAAFRTTGKTASSSGTAVTGFSGTFVAGNVGDYLIDVASGEYRKITEYTSGTAVTIEAAFTSNLSTSDVVLQWAYADDFGVAPGTSTWASAHNSAHDEVHIVVVDEDGDWSGTKNTILEKYAFLSKHVDAKTEQNDSNFYKDVLNASSKYVRFVDEEASDWGTSAADFNDASDATHYTYSFINGANGSAAALGDYELCYDLFTNTTQYDTSLVICPPLFNSGVTEALGQYLIDNIAETRKDCVVFISPRKTDVLPTDSSRPVDNCIDFRNDLSRSSSYAFVDCNWKYMYDKYNDVYLWVPLSGDTAGLAARTDFLRDPWWSPAGYDRGRIKNVTKLAWNPSESDRDAIYPVGVNPVITQANIGTILYGDKTLLSKPSAFDRINVRRLFIVLEKAISTASKYMLFEFNDEVTRNTFKSMVEPFLREVKARRGIYDFLVVCDETNNTGEVIDRNEFVGDIYIKPARSINFIQLNFIAVRTGVSFNEVVGRF